MPTDDNRKATLNARERKLQKMLMVIFWQGILQSNNKRTKRNCRTFSDRWISSTRKSSVIRAFGRKSTFSHQGPSFSTYWRTKKTFHWILQWILNVLSHLPTSISTTKIKLKLCLRMDLYSPLRTSLGRTSDFSNMMRRLTGANRSDRETKVGRVIATHFYFTLVRSTTLELIHYHV